MSFGFEPSEPVGDGVRRMCIEQIDKAVDELRAPDSGTDEAVHESVHEARKCFKKIRAVLRLVRPALGDTYASENAWFRDEARDLSRVRDASALIETIERLESLAPDTTDDASFVDVRRALVARRDRVAQLDADLPERIDRLVAGLGHARSRASSWTLSSEGFGPVGAGLARTYKRGRHALRATYDAPSPEAFHELRKRSKYHRYQMQVLEPVWPAVLGAYVDQLHQLTDLLGHNQDLEVLRTTLLTEPDLLESARDRHDVLGQVQEQQTVLRAEAQELGRTVFSDRPRALRSRLGALWSAWHTG